MNNIYDLKIFEGINKDIIDELLFNSKEVTFAKGSIITTEGQESNQEGYIIKEGSIEVKINGKIITTLNTGEIFGEIALLNDENRTATTQALTDVVLIVLNLENLIELINNDTNKINKEIIRRIEENLENEQKIGEEITA